MLENITRHLNFCYLSIFYKSSRFFPFFFFFFFFFDISSIFFIIFFYESYNTGEENKKKWLNNNNKNRFASKRAPVKKSRERGSSDRFKNITCERKRRRKLKGKSLKLSTNDTKPSPPEASTCKLMPSGYNQIASNISSRKCKNENLRESYASVTIQKKDDQLERSIHDSADFAIESKRSCENKSVRDSKIDFSELLRS